MYTTSPPEQPPSDPPQSDDSQQGDAPVHVHSCNVPAERLSERVGDAKTNSRDVEPESAQPTVDVAEYAADTTLFTTEEAEIIQNDQTPFNTEEFNVSEHDETPSSTEDVSSSEHVEPLLTTEEAEIIKHVEKPSATEGVKFSEHREAQYTTERVNVSELDEITSPTEVSVSEHVETPITTEEAETIKHDENPSATKEAHVSEHVEAPSTAEIESSKHDEAPFVQEQTAEESDELAQASTEVSSISAPHISLRLLLMDIFKRSLQHGLLPEVTAETDAVSPDCGTPCWKVTISLDELGLSASGYGSKRPWAEVAAAIQFDLILSSPEALAKLETFPRTGVTTQNVADIIRNYCQMMSISFEDTRKDVVRTQSDAYESRIFSGETQLGKPTVLAVKDLAKGINNLALVHSIIKGHSDVWPAGLDNPFQAKIVVDDARMEKLQSLIKAARHCLTTIPGHGPDASSRGSYYNDVNKANGQVPDQHAIARAVARRSLDLDSFFAGLPFSASTTKMLILGASIRCLEPAIILAALERLGNQSVYRNLAHGEEYHGEHLDPCVKNTVHGDHSGLVLLFQRLRNAHKNFQEVETEDDPKAAERFGNFDPSGVGLLDVAARDIERILISAGLAAYPGVKWNARLPGSELQVRAQPYGGRLNMNSTKMDIVRHLLAMGFGHNIAQYGYGTLVPGAVPELRVGSQRVHIESPLRAPMTVKQLKKNLQNGPLVVFSGASEHPEGHGLTARYSSPITTWQAVLLGKDLSLAEETRFPASPGTEQLVINGWLPVLVKSQVQGVSDRQVRDMVIKARQVLHHAILKAMLDYTKDSWTTIDVYKLLSHLPSEVGIEAKQNALKLGKKKKSNAREKKDAVC